METQGQGLTMSIEKLKENISYNTDIYEENDYYHDFEYIKLEDWEIQYPDEDSMFYDKILAQRNHIVFRDRPFIIDGMNNAYNHNDEVIGGFNYLD